MTSKNVSKRFMDISEQVTVVIEKYNTMDIEYLYQNQDRVYAEMAEAKEESGFNFIDTDLILELYHINSNIIDRLQSAVNGS